MVNLNPVHYWYCFHSPIYIFTMTSYVSMKRKPLELSELTYQHHQSWLWGGILFFKERVRQLSHFNWLEYKPFCLGLNSQIGLRQNEDSVIRSPQISYYKQWYRCNRSPAIPPTLCLHRFWNLCCFFFVPVKGIICKKNIYICVYKTGIGWPVSNCQQRLLKRVIKVGLELDFT